jgi:hypothetical protein
MKLFLSSEFAPIRLKLVELLEQVSSNKLYDYRAHDLFRKFLFDFGCKPQPQELNTSDDLTNWKRIKLIFKTNISLRIGHRRWKSYQEQENIDLYPARELIRCADAQFKRNWKQRWLESGGRLFGERMVALWNDPVWEHISAFGLPYPPFDLEDDMGDQSVERQEAISLGLLEPPKPHDWEKYPKIIINGQEFDKKAFDELEEEISHLKFKVTVSVDGKVLQSKEMPAKIKERKKFPPPLEIFDTPEERMKWITPRTLPPPGELYYFDVLPSFARTESDSELTAYFLDELRTVDTSSPFYLLEQALALKYEADCKGKLSQQAGAQIINSITQAFEKGLTKYPIAAARGYRCTAEILDAWGETENAISYYEYAINCNPNVGVKRRLTLLKKKT